MNDTDIKLLTNDSPFQVTNLY